MKKNLKEFPHCMNFINIRLSKNEVIIKSKPTSIKNDDLDNVKNEKKYNEEVELIKKEDSSILEHWIESIDLRNEFSPPFAKLSNCQYEPNSSDKKQN